MFRPTSHFQRPAAPIDTAIMLIKDLTTNKGFEAFHVPLMVENDPTVPKVAPALGEEEARARYVTEAPVILLSEIHRNKPVLQAVLNGAAVESVSHAYELFKWLLAGFDDRLAGQFDARLHLEKFHFEEFAFSQMGPRPAIKANNVFLILGDISQPYHPGYMPNFPW